MEGGLGDGVRSHIAWDMKTHVRSHEISQQVGLGSMGIGGGPVHIAFSQAGSSGQPGVAVAVRHSQQSWVG